MAGNVWDWTRSLCGKKWDKPDFKYPYDPGDGREDLGAGNDVLRVLRGGAFYNDQWYARCACRDGDYPFNWLGDLGFRVCVAPGF
jgi:iron(II)-dependent oxidoreductase